MNYRGRLDIIADILNVVSKEAKKTQIMYQANLSYNVLQKYIRELSAASLVSFLDEKRCYQLTEKGRRFLEAYEEYSKTKKLVDQHLNDVASRRKGLLNLCPDSVP